MKEGWEYKKLGEICSFIGDGDWIESKDQSDMGIRLIQTGNIGNGYFKAKEDKPHYISEVTFDRLGCTEILEGDCLISRLPEPIGRACIVPKLNSKMITAVDCTILRFQPFMNSSFFTYYTKCSKYQQSINKKTTGTTRKRISRKNLESILIPVPPIDQQHRIVSELDLLSSIIEKQKNQLKELDTLAQSIFYDMFGDPVTNEKGWDVKLLGDVCKFSQGMQVPTPDQLMKQERGYERFLRIVDFTQGNEPARYVVGDKNSKCYITEDEIAIVRYGTPGFVCRGKAGIIANNLFKIEPQFEMDYTYLEFYLRSSAFQAPIKTTQYGATMQAIKFSTIEKLAIELPPLPLQQQFAEKIQSIESQKATISKSIAESEKLFDYTMDKYFG